MFFPNFCSDKSTWKDHSWFTHSWVHWRREARSWARKNSASVRYIVQVERRVLRCSSGWSQRCEVTVRSLLEFVSCVPDFSTAAWNTGHQISFHISNNHSHTDPVTAVTPSRWAHPGRFLSRLEASRCHDKLAMLARKRWAHHSSRSMGTKSAAQQKHSINSKIHGNVAQIQICCFHSKHNCLNFPTFAFKLNTTLISTCFTLWNHLDHICIFKINVVVSK